MTTDRWSPAIPAPGLIVTLGEIRDVRETIPWATDHLQRIRPEIIMPHMIPDRRVPEVARTLRELVKDARVWVQTPANMLVGDDDTKVTERVRAWVTNCCEARVEVLVFNGEGSSGLNKKTSEPRPGWKSGQPMTADQLAKRAQLVLDVARDAAGEDLTLGWSTHDQLGSHGRGGLPVGVWFGPSSPVMVNLSQEYTFAQPRFATLTQARARHESTARDHKRVVAAGTVRADLASDGAGYAVIGQMHHHETNALAYYLDRSALSGAWTMEPGSCDPKGLLALEADVRLRERAGHEAGRINRWRAQCGMGPGPLDEGVLGSLGLTE